MTRLAAALLLALLAAQAAAPARAAIDRDAVANAHAAPARAPWWAAFQDPVLDGLMARASGGAPAEAAALRAYVELRITQARLLLTERLQQAAAQQHAMLERLASAEQDATQDDQRRQWLAASTARNEHWQAVQQTLAAERDTALATLAAWTHGSPADLAAALAAADADAGADPLRLPQVQAPLPERMAVADDAAAAQLQALQASATQALQMRQLVQADELALRASQLRSEAGSETALDVIEVYQRLLADNDRLAHLAGGVALAWAQLLQSTGGRAAQAVDAASAAPWVAP